MAQNRLIGYTAYAALSFLDELMHVKSSDNSVFVAIFLNSLKNVRFACRFRALYSRPASVSNRNSRVFFSRSKNLRCSQPASHSSQRSSTYRQGTTQVEDLSQHD